MNPAALAERRAGVNEIEEGEECEGCEGLMAALI